jgi:hypothetical protein
VLPRDGRVDLRREAHHGERAADSARTRAAEQVRDPHLRVLLDDLDAVAAEGRGNPFAVQQLPVLGPSRRHLRGKQERGNI